ncbi:M20/M25/M40 family metallo-hydrolase [Granulicella cerasi]|uniref:M20/M25/M40 family metallo-hydrolase n=1 Tax=Granulicella cerasi TaxID=741063 RepID=A0ABW1Z5U5_9BACT|nr:M20/M25/M40 family metallo-hydrolase [Granulicella cerasi]
MRRLAMVAALCAGVAASAVAQVKAPAGQDAFAREVLKTLIETNTTHSTGSTTTAAEKMREVLLKAGFPAGDMVIVGPNDKRMNLVARYRSPKPTAKPLLVIIHLDVVEAKRADWTMDPFVLNETDGYFYGRGTQDVKSGVAAYVVALAELKKAGWQPKRDIILALTADEESGGNNGVAWLLKNRRDLVNAEVVVNPDAGGLVLRKGKASELELEATEKTYADYTLRVTNPGGHSSLPVPDNAIYAEAAALGKIEHAPFPVELNAVTRAYYEQEQKLAPPARAALIARVLQTPMDTAAAAELSAKFPGDNAALHTTCVATMIKGGHAPNALPGSVDANVNCRILPGHSLEEVRQQLVAKIDDPRVKVLFRGDDDVDTIAAPSKPLMVPPVPRADVMEPLRATVDSMWPGLPILPKMEAGASDSIYTMGEGIPSYGFSPIGIEAGDDRAHGRDERIPVKGYYDGVEFTRRFVKALGDR